MSVRPVRQISRTKAALEGAGVRLQRAFGFGDTTAFDPFLLFDDFRNDDPTDYLAGFPWHPHRGIETITYVLAGSVEHGDSLGNRGSLGAGDVQWMTAGRGIMHQEMPKGDPAGRMHGFQLWANLPASLKMTAPRYQDVASTDIPEVVDDDGTRVRVVCGEFWGKAGPVEGVAANPRYLDVSVPPGRRRRIQVDRASHAFAYVFARVGNLPRCVAAAGHPHRGGRRDDAARAARRGREPLARALRSGRRDRGAGGRRGSAVPARLGPAHRGTGGVVRPHRHEHGAGAAPGAAGAAQRDVHPGLTRAAAGRPAAPARRRAGNASRRGAQARTSGRSSLSSGGRRRSARQATTSTSIRPRRLFTSQTDLARSRSAGVRRRSTSRPASINASR